ncbi:MAG: ABC transporter substrate-binding protein [Stappiaceae bacterium]
MPQRWFQNLIFLAMLILAASISSHAAEAPLKKVAIGIDWFVNPNHGPLIVALEKGYFADAGLEVTLVPPENTLDNVAMVLDGRVAVGMSAQPRTMIGIAEGKPLAIVGTLIPVPLNIILAVEGGPIKKISDLRGKRIGYADSAKTERELLRISLARHGIPIEDVTLVDVGFSMVPAMLEDKVDALTDAYRNFEPVQVIEAGKKPLVFNIEQGAIPAYSELVYIVDKRTADPALIEKFLTAVEHGVRTLTEDPIGAWELFIKYDPKLNTDLNKRSWQATAPLFALRPGLVDEARYERFADFLIENKIVDSLPAPTAYLIRR